MSRLFHSRWLSDLLCQSHNLIRVPTNTAPFRSRFCWEGFHLSNNKYSQYWSRFAGYAVGEKPGAPLLFTSPRVKRLVAAGIRKRQANTNRFAALFHSHRCCFSSASALNWSAVNCCCAGGPCSDAGHGQCNFEKWRTCTCVLLNVKFLILISRVHGRPQTIKWMTEVLMKGSSRDKFTGSFNMTHVLLSYRQQQHSWFPSSFMTKEKIGSRNQMRANPNTQPCIPTRWNPVAQMPEPFR